MKKLISIIIIIAFAVTSFGCASMSVTGDQRADGAGLGAILGGIAGYLIGGNATGAAIGAAIGGGLGYAIGAAAKNAAEEAAKTDKPVEFKSENGNIGVAERIAFDPVTKCAKVRVREFDDNSVAVDRMQDVCPVAQAPATAAVN